VLRLLGTKDSPTAEIKFREESSESRSGRDQVQMLVPILEAQNRAGAVAPGALYGAEVYKQFEDKMWYKGIVGAFNTKSGWYRVTYDDGDSEDMDTAEILGLLFKSMPSWDFCPPWQLDTHATALKAPRVVPHGDHPDDAGTEKKKTATRKGLGRQKRQKVATASDGEYTDDYTIGTGDTSSEENPSSADIDAGTSQAARDNISPVISPPRVPHKYPLAGGAPVAVRPNSPPLAPSTAPVEEEETGIEAGSLPEDVDMIAAAGSGRSSGTTTTAGAAAAPAAAPAGTLGPATQPQPQAVLPVSSDSDNYAPSGAGHQRGALAYDRHNKTFRAIGKWIVDYKIGTLLGRFNVDKRYLDYNEDHVSCNRTGAVPGWLGVRGTFQTVENDGSGDGADGGNKIARKHSTTPAKGKTNQKSFLGAPYTLVYYNPQQAKQCHLLYPTFSTVEDAAKMYDKFALSYYDPSEADLNYPLEPEARIKAANTWQKEYSKVTGRKASVALAVDILNFEMSIPDGAVAVTEGTATTEDWEKFE